MRRLYFCALVLGFVGFFGNRINARDGAVIVATTSSSNSLSDGSTTTLGAADNRHDAGVQGRSRHPGSESRPHVPRLCRPYCSMNRRRLLSVVAVSGAVDGCFIGLRRGSPGRDGRPRPRE